ncbi:9616_t:CDS:2 [Diversispora eburnea]|uniref:9616_t:CDS:1 n=1 Tax=Diversispora eburnea TaxID=1213867 RepID=A0A9N9CG78_9GLOM|nr:9616_t:CDS:2 [Diversispora eburnea]
MSGFDIATFLDKKNRILPKPFNIRLDFDMRSFDTLSTIKQNETPFQ